MKHLCLVPVIVAALLLSATANAELAARLFVNGDSNRAIQAGQPELWEIEIYDTTSGERVKDFVASHMKFMHLVVIRDDLSEFAHFHPFYDPSTGLFQTVVNLPTANPDNQAAEQAVPRPGHYMVFAEAKSKEHGLRSFRMAVTSEGRDSDFPLVVDQQSESGDFFKYYDADAKAGDEGSEYRVRFSFETVPGDGGELVRFFLTFESLQADGSYNEVEEMQTWLMMGGHGILVSSSGGDDRLYGHMHSAWPEEGGVLTFSYFNRGALLEELNKVWFQFKHHDVIYTVPFVFHYTAN